MTTSCGFHLQLWRTRRGGLIRRCNHDILLLLLLPTSHHNHSGALTGTLSSLCASAWPPCCPHKHCSHTTCLLTCSCCPSAQALPLIDHGTSNPASGQVRCAALLCHGLGCTPALGTDHVGQCPPHNSVQYPAPSWPQYPYPPYSATTPPYTVVVQVSCPAMEGGACCWGPAGS